MARREFDPVHNPGPYPKTKAQRAEEADLEAFLNAPKCAECGDVTIPGVNSDFCSKACEDTWETAHTWPCPECHGTCVVEVDCRFVNGTPTLAVEEPCEACHRSGVHVDFDRRHCDWEGCPDATTAGQNFCTSHLAIVQGASEGVRHAP
jgi:hypothetical protein